MDWGCFVLLDIYMPCESLNNVSKYMLIREETINTCEQLKYNSNIIREDLNISFTQILRSFLAPEDFRVCIGNDSSVSDNNTYCIDQFIASGAPANSVTSYCSLRDCDNSLLRESPDWY